MKGKMYKKLALALAVCCAGVLPGWATEFMPISDVREGMHGYAKTVVHGRDIETFDVDVLGVLKNKGANGGDLVLVKVSGPLIDQTRGIAQGMSGSPVYIDGKLLGAIGYGFPNSDGRIGMVTPIEDMVKVWTMDDKDASGFMPRPSSDLMPLATPLMASGYSEDSLEYLAKKMEEFNMVPYASAVTNGDDTPLPLEEGGAVAASFVTGDLKLGAIGTVTYIDGNRMLAFGHPFMSRGKTSYFMGNSYIFTVVPSHLIPFKLGSIGADIGIVDQDRGAAISGISGMLPHFTALHVQANDIDNGNQKKLDVRMVPEEALLPSLSATTVYSAVSRLIDRRGEGTVSLTYTLYPIDPKQPTFTRKNMYWSRNDVAERSVDEIYNVVKILEQNRFDSYPLRQIKVDMDVTRERKTAQIVDATATPMIVSPGDDIFIRVRIQPYRGEKEVKPIVFTVPENQAYGDMILEVRGGGIMPLPYLIRRQKYNLTSEILERLRTYKNFKDLHGKLQKEDRNNQIVVEILDPEVSTISNEEEGAGDVKIQNQEKPKKPDYIKGPSAEEEEDEDPDTSAKSAVDTEYVIYGDCQFTFKVMRPADRDVELKKLAAKNAKSTLEMKSKAAEEKDDEDSADDSKDKKKQDKEKDKTKEKDQQKKDDKSAEKKEKDDSADTDKQEKTNPEKETAEAESLRTLIAKTPIFSDFIPY